MSIKALQEYTRFSKYARYKPEDGRRETWEEQVDRVFAMHEKKLGEDKVNEFRDDFEFARNMVLKKRVLGSQRALQFGGDPVLSKNARIYNCTVSYCDRARFFQECIYLLLCGCGCGFSVQKHHVAKLPPLVAPTKGEKGYVIPDSIEGWADALGVLMSSYFDSDNTDFPEYKGYEVKFDYSQIRPEGARLSSGGKAPGPDGLRRALEKIEYLLNKRAIHQGELRPIDAYDVCMHASDAVLSGGIRRSASIAIFSPDDDEMAKAKTGSWFIDNPQRGRSNNSALLVRDKTSKEDFSSLIKMVKEFGEPGFIWSDHEDTLYNPCVTADGWIQTDRGPRRVSDLINKPFKAVVNGKTHDSSEKGFFQTGKGREIYKIETNEGFWVRATDNHRFLVKDGDLSQWKEVSQLVDGDKIVLHEHRDHQWKGDGNEMEGWLLGSLVGDGTFDENSACLDYWGETRYEMNNVATKYIKEYGLETYHNIRGGDAVAKVGKRRIYSVGLSRLAEEFGITKENKEIGDFIEMGSYDFYRGFLRGYFDADGTVQASHLKGASVRLWSASILNLECVQRMLLRLNIYSKIYKDRQKEGMRLLPDGQGGEKEYYCQSGHELVISKSSVKTFSEKVGFADRLKAIELQDLISSYRRRVSQSQFIGTVKRIISDGNADVYDCTIPGPHAFDANGFYAHNCVEIGFCAYLDLDDEIVKKDVQKRGLESEIEKVKQKQGSEERLSGWSFCNLCEINMKKCKTKESFIESCKAAAIIGTIQASYDHFEYLGPVSDSIVRREALLGVSMTGMADSPDVAFDPDCQRAGAKTVLEVNERIADIIGINKCARGTCVKPAGSTSCVLGSASGIHPHHAKRYFRRVQANKLEIPLQYFSQFNPLAIEESVWSANKTDVVVTFLCEVPDGAKTKNQVGAIPLLENVKLTQQNWVEYGTRQEQSIRPWLRHNVSNTCTVKPEEWEDVEKFIYKNRKWFAGISLLPSSGDKDYPQAPFTAIYTPTETVRKYGDGSMFASGLIVDGHRAFSNDLWAACDCALEVGEVLDVDTLRSKISKAFETNGQYWKDEGLAPDSPTRLLSAWLEHNVINYFEKLDWVRRAKQFALRYFEDDLREMTYCLKDVYNWKVWCDLSREYVDVDWSGCFETEAGELDFEAGAACGGGACELGDLGLMIKDKMNERKEMAEV